MSESSGPASPAQPEALPVYRASPEDFIVDEIPLYPPSGEGEHTFVRVEKRLRTSDEVARLLAREAGLRERDVGYAGRKDRFAVTRQWFSVPGLDPARARALELPGVEVLDAIPHRHKLRTGQLRANRFVIWVRGIDLAGLERAQQRLAFMREHGMPNRFGDQRFGRAGDNAEQGREILLGRRRPKNARAARFLVSALQAAVFNDVLRARPLPLDRVERGDLAMKHDSGGVFLVEDEAHENERAGRFEISATGPIFGTKMTEPAEAPARREAEAMAAHGLPALDELRAPRGLRVRGARRALRVPVANLDTLHEGADLRLSFELATGSYATVLLEEAFGSLREGGGGRDAAADRAATGDP